MTIYALGDKVPQIAESAYIHPQASVIGDVVIGERVFVAPMASIRGDYGRIEIGDESNVQDGVVIHSHHAFVTTIGKRVNIGHNASLHSEYVADGASVGIGAVLMLGSKVAEGVMIGNCALLRPGTVTEPHKIYVGVPAKLLREIKESDSAREMIDEFLDRYVENSRWYPRDLRRIE